MNIYPIVRKEYNAQQCCAHLRKSLYFVRKVLLRVVFTGIIRDLSEVTYLISTLFFFFSLGETRRARVLGIGTREGK